MSSSRRIMSSHDQVAIGAVRLRVVLLFLLAMLGFGVIATALYFEQIEAGEDHRQKIVRQSVRRIRIPARRGSIFTRDLQMVAGSRVEYSLLFYPEEMRQRRLAATIDYIMTAADRISEATGRSHRLDRQSVLRHLNTRPGLPITVLEDLNPVEIARTLECIRDLHGIDIQADAVRDYPGGSFAAHIVGDTKLENSSDASDRADFFYYVPDRVGRSGVEKAFDVLPGGAADGAPGLRGRPGYSLAEVDHLGFIHRNLIEKIEPIHGSSVVLTIDSRAQRIAESLLNGTRGAVVALDAANGDVLAAASAPAFDLKKFTPRLPPEYYRKLLNDPGRPLVNRALQGVYSPGSIFKVLVAMAFADSGVDPAATVFCDGVARVGNASIRCAAYRRGGHGAVDLVRALAWSCNTYMIVNALQTGVDSIRLVLESAGIGQLTGIELPERSGVFPTDAAKRLRFGTGWNSYDTALLSMGQGIVALTPLQAAVYCAAIANGGTRWQPHVVERMVDTYGNALYVREKTVTGQLAVSPRALELVRRGMYEVVNSEAGSGRHAALDELRIYGKTGSAEVGPRDNRRLTTWFIAFTTFEERTVALAIVVEDGKSGGSSCAPLAAEFFRRYFLTGRSTESGTTAAR